MSTKSGLDPGAVWQAWAMASLKAGSLTAAREKFARCLKAPVDRNQINMGPTLLQEIVKHLESTVRPVTATVHASFFLCSPPSQAPPSHLRLHFPPPPRGPMKSA